MAKIKSVQIQPISENISIGNEIINVVINTQIEFHPIDLKLEMEYLLHLFVYDIHGKADVPVIIGNWDESYIKGVLQDRRDHLFGKAAVNITATKQNIEIETVLNLKLGQIDVHSYIFSRTLEVFATLIPAVGRASKWSEPVEANLVF